MNCKTQVANIHFCRPAYKDDEFCDDENNFEGCNFDGGACCGNDVQKNYCTECKCLDPNAGNYKKKYI